MDRLVPRRAGRLTPFRLPAIETVADLPRATEALLQAVAEGELTPSEASEIGKVLDLHLQVVNTAEIVERLAALERKGGGEP